MAKLKISVFIGCAKRIKLPEFSRSSKSERSDMTSYFAVIIFAVIVLSDFLTAHFYYYFISEQSSPSTFNCLI